MKKIFLSPFLLALALACAPSSPPPSSLQQPQPTPPARKPAGVASWLHADWLEREGRIELEKPEVVIEAMHLKDGDVVADLGCGTGFFTRRIAKVVAPSGKVYAEDIQPEMLDLLKKYVAGEGITNVVPVLGTETDPKLPRGQMDWILLVDVYHEFQEPAPMLAKIREALKPGGHIALVEYRAEDPTVAPDVPPPHRMSVDQILREWRPAGFEMVERIETLPSQHLLVFTAGR
jgi:ubiquinone/menaquinone biosynthesis C-methylase UbiE